MMKYDTFRDNVMALMDARKKQKELHARRAPLGVLEDHAIQIAKLRGQLMSRLRSGDYKKPTFTSLCDATIQGMKFVINGERDKGESLIRMAHVIRDLAYPGKSLKTEESSELMKQIRSING